MSLRRLPRVRDPQERSFRIRAATVAHWGCSGRLAVHPPWRSRGGERGVSNGQLRTCHLAHVGVTAEHRGFRSVPSTGTRTHPPPAAPVATFLGATKVQLMRHCPDRTRIKWPLAMLMPAHTNALCTFRGWGAGLCFRTLLLSLGGGGGSVGALPSGGRPPPTPPHQKNFPSEKIYNSNRGPK